MKLIKDSYTLARFLELLHKSLPNTTYMFKIDFEPSVLSVIPLISYEPTAKCHCNVVNLSFSTYPSHHRTSNFAESCKAPLRSFRTSWVNNCTLTFQTPFASSVDNVTPTLLSKLGFNMPSLRQQILYISPSIGLVLSCPNSNKDNEIVNVLLVSEGVKLIASIRCYN